LGNDWLRREVLRASERVMVSLEPRRLAVTGLQEEEDMLWNGDEDLGTSSDIDEVGQERLVSAFTQDPNV
jgi:hypothetical protein